MKYQVLSLKWRPKSFDNVVGQDHIVQTLVNAFSLNRIAQSYLFTGPRGVGKTTTARIMAMALNAENGPSADFDSSSETSREISGGRSLDVLEIDGASNRGIDEIRGLREQIKFSPMNGAYKVIIIDEVHMLTNQAFNALLTTLEEPPAHAVFIFATTDIHKIPATIISRCQRYDFNRISINIISSRLKYILESEQIESDSESIYMIANKADGSMRDALSILDQIIAYCGDKIENTKVSNVLGIIDVELYFEFFNAIHEKHYDDLINVLSSFFISGVPASELINGLQNHLRNLIYAGVDENLLHQINDEQKLRFKSEKSKWDKRDLFRMNQVFIDVSSVIRSSDDPYLLLEMTCLKLLEMDKTVFIEELLSESKEFKPNALVTEDRKKQSELKNNIEVVNKFEGTKENKKVEILDDEDDRISNNSNEGQTGNSTKNIKNNNIDYIKNIWPEILSNVHELKPTVGGVLENFFPDSIQENKIILKSDNPKVFNRELMYKGMPTIEGELSKKFGVNLKIEIEVENKVTNHKSENAINPKIEENNEKVFNKVVDLFDGEIVQ
ncbi:MAG: hypothetical protein CMG60_06490 [Candidatus Marinimicrobia bacterium]|nr:hypothetical protein [Candidatus Neomarinimicrobiota bacterium]